MSDSFTILESKFNEIKQIINSANKEKEQVALKWALSVKEEQKMRSEIMILKHQLPGQQREQRILDNEIVDADKLIKVLQQNKELLEIKIRQRNQIRTLKDKIYHLKCEIINNQQINENHQEEIEQVDNKIKELECRILSAKKKRLAEDNKMKINTWKENLDEERELNREVKRLKSQIKAGVNQHKKILNQIKIADQYLVQARIQKDITIEIKIEDEGEEILNQKKRKSSIGSSSSCKQCKIEPEDD